MHKSSVDAAAEAQGNKQIRRSGKSFRDQLRSSGGQSTAWKLHVFVKVLGAKLLFVIIKDI